MKVYMASKGVNVPENDEEIALWIIKGETKEARQSFMVNWLRGQIAIPDEVKLRIWLMENDKRGIKPGMEG